MAVGRWQEDDPLMGVEPWAASVAMERRWWGGWWRYVSSDCEACMVIPRCQQCKVRVGCVPMLRLDREGRLTVSLNNHFIVARHLAGRHNDIYMDMRTGRVGPGERVE